MKHSEKNKAFTLIELLVVIAIIAALLAITGPPLRRARQQAKIVAVNSDLYQIALGLEMYMNDNRGIHPPSRRDCGQGWDDSQLPPELVDCGYLPAPSRYSTMSARMEDRFNPGVTYKYAAVGPYYQNGDYMPDQRAFLFVPPGFPAGEGEPENDLLYDDPKTSPVLWVLYSLGPNGKASENHEWEMIKVLNGPVARRSWYTPEKNKGLIVRLRMRNGRHLGSFEDYK
jgi:prepilin-type N-terminal cleavage/methylation domain-containing protein